jgi:hypothetical protein
MIDLNKELLANLPNGVTVSVKSGWFWESLAFLVKVFTFGKNSTFMTQYSTTIGNKIRLSQTAWDYQTTDPGLFYQTISHELTHVAQFKKYGLGSVWLGVIVQSILYLLLPIPMGFAYFRYKFESEAYLVGFKATWRFLKNSGETFDIVKIREDFIDDTFDFLTASNYGFAMYFRKVWVRIDLTNRFDAIKETDL